MMKRIIEVYDVTRLITKMMEDNVREVFGGKAVF